MTTRTYISDLEATEAALVTLAGRVERRVTLTDLSDAVKRSERTLDAIGFKKGDRKAVSITINPSRHRAGQGWTWRATCVVVVLRWAPSKRDWYIDMDASGKESALVENRENDWESRLEIEPEALDVVATLRRGLGITIGRDKDGYDAEGFDVNGWDREGFDRQGFSTSTTGRTNREGVTSNGKRRDDFDVDAYIARFQGVSA